MIGLLAKLIVVLNANTRPGEIASAISFGFWLALIPGGNLLWFLIFTVAFFLKQNTAAFLLSLAGFRIIAPLTDALLDYAGALILEQPALEPFFTGLYNVPLAPYTSFNNTVVFGGLVLGALFWIPLFYLFRFLINLYRKGIAPKIAENPIIKGFKKVPIISKILTAVRLEARL